MIYRFIFFAITLLSWQITFAQAPNLVPNGSFETRTNCIWNNGDVEDAPPWFNPTDATPDIFHECAVIDEDPCPWPDQSDLDPWMFGTPTNARGCENPYDGVGYAGFFVFGPDYNGFNGYKEYIGIRLNETMEAGTDYTVKFYVSLSERSGYAVWNLQVYFSQDSLTPMDTLPIFYNSYIDVDPQLSGTPGEFITNYNGWHEMAWDYTATGNENFMYIGSFQRGSEMDTIYVLPVNPFGNNDSFSYYYIDDIQVREGSLSLNNIDLNNTLKLFPNPTFGKLSVESAELISKIDIFDVQGRSVFKQQISPQTKLEMDISSLSMGIYFVQIQLTDEQQIIRKILKR